MGASRTVLPPASGRPPAMVYSHLRCGFPDGPTPEAWNSPLKVGMESTPLGSAACVKAEAPPRCPRGANTVNAPWTLESVGATWSLLGPAFWPKAGPVAEITAITNARARSILLEADKLIHRSDQITWMRRDLQILFEEEPPFRAALAPQVTRR